MIIKTMLLGLISAGAAGSVMYFGTLPSDATDDLEPVAPKTNETVKRLPSVRDPIQDKRVQRGPAVESDVAPKRTLREVIAGNRAASPQSGDMPPQDATERKWLDKYLPGKNRDSDEGDTEDERQTESDVKAEGEMPAKVELDDAPQTPETKTPESADADNKAVQYFKIENGVLVEVDGVVTTDSVEMFETPVVGPKLKSVTVPEGSSLRDVLKDRPLAEPRDQNSVIMTVMKQAASISKPELRDQAYFEIVDYALTQNDFSAAEDALSNIAQEDINYTAKSRIAVAFAQRGMAGMAFATIDSVQDIELRDFMRLQVIQALVSPQNLPPQWREGEAPRQPTPPQPLR